jgi:hypothetical protein
MKKTAWSHLPNAVHIDRVLASVKAHPDVWGAARNAARFAAWADARDAAWYAARYAARSAALNAARYAALNAARYAAWLAIAALIAWDDSAQYLSMTSDQLKMWYHLTERPACLLLLPAVRAFEQINEMEMV